MMFPSVSPPPSALLLLLLPYLPLLFLLPCTSLPSATPALPDSPLSWTSPQDPCYHADGRPRHCLPEFINAAYGLPVAAEEQRRPDVAALTDLHNPHNLTCWAAPDTGGVGGDWVLTLPLGRRFEVTYISLQFCHQGEPRDPVSISVLKSMDQGRSWRPMQHYSADCPGTFGLPARAAAQTRQQETEPLCSDPRPLQRHRGGVVLAFSTLDGRPSAPDFDYSPTLQDWVTATDIRVVFHRDAPHNGGVGVGGGAGVLQWKAGSKGGHGDRVPSAGGRGGQGVEKAGRKGPHKGLGQAESGHNATGKDGVRGAGRDNSPSGRAGRKGKGRRHRKEHLHQVWAVEAGQGRGSKVQELRRRRNHGPDKGAPRAVVMASPAPPLALSDLQVGGRCKCNGHASRCRRDDASRAACMCEHHTAGPDCDVCEDFYYDRPWHRATPTQPNPCVACQCNGHSTKCRFSMEVFQQSGRRSGGVCLKCRHHTAGRHCHYCQSGFTRDHSKDLSHRKACQPCQCHPMGAVGHWCNHTSGQCLCRAGVTGLRCNRCAPGYKQGRSPLQPCIQIQEVAPTPLYQPQYSIAEECVSYCQPSQVKVKMNLETYCLKDYVLKVQVRGMERSGPWWQFSVSVQTVFRAGSTSHVRRGLQALWVPDRDLGCGCPALPVGRTLLLIGAEESGRDRGPGERRLVADRATLALQWRDHWSQKLRGFRGHDKRGRCPPAGPPARAPPPRGIPQPGYVPPHLLPDAPERTLKDTGYPVETGGEPQEASGVTSTPAAPTPGCPTTDPA